MGATTTVALLLLAAGTAPLGGSLLTPRPVLAQVLPTPPAPQLPASPAPAAPRSAGGSAPTRPAPTPNPEGSDMVTIESDQQLADNRTGIVTATGNVRITYPERGLVATARQAQYFSREARLVLSGDVEVVDGDGQRIRAERLTYRLDSERLQAEPTGGRQVMSRLRLQSPSGRTAAPSLLP
ncbi:MAG: LptA/OstA family protein [Cyanobium sp.]